MVYNDNSKFLLRIYNVLSKMLSILYLLYYWKIGSFFLYLYILV